MRTFFAFIAAGTLIGALSVTGCGTAACNANTCGGCCTSAGVCQPGVKNDECGAAGVRCDVCSTIQSCQAGKCTSATGGGAGGSGGSGGAGGGGALAYKRVFVTNATYNGNLAAAGGKSTGLEGGDALCNTAATAAALGGTWAAWLSDGTTRAVDRITGNGPWKKLDSGRTTVFNNKANLSTLPLVPIEYNENGASVGTAGSLEPVWSGTATGGAISTSNHCTGWSSTLGTATIGDARGTNDWTDYGSVRSCSSSYRLYCFEL